MNAMRLHLVDFVVLGLFPHHLQWVLFPKIWPCLINFCYTHSFLYSFIHLFHVFFEFLLQVQCYANRFRTKKKITKCHCFKRLDFNQGNQQQVQRKFMSCIVISIKTEGSKEHCRNRQVEIYIQPGDSQRRALVGYDIKLN